MAATTRSEYVPPPDPDFQELAKAGWFAWVRDKPEVIAFDTETTGVSFHDTAFCVTVAWVRGHDEGSSDGPPIEAHYFELGDPQREEAVRRILRDTPVLVGHNIKFDLQKTILAGLLDRHTLTSHRIQDTEGLAHLEDEHRRKALKLLAVTVLGVEDTIEVEIATGPNKGKFREVPREKHELDSVRRKLKLKKEDGYHRLPRAVLMPYAVKDAELTQQLYEQLKPKVDIFPDLSSLYDQERELTLVLLDMEAAGLGVDEAYVAAQVKAYTARVLATEQRIAQITGKCVVSAILPPTEEVGNAFNPNSNPQIAEFFTAAGLEHPKYDKSVLTKLDHPLAAELLSLRNDLKKLNTYFRALQKETVDGVFHPWFRQYGTVTGRTSSGSAQED